MIAALRDKTWSGAFLKSSMNSGPDASTLHLRNVAILNKPRFDYRIWVRKGGGALLGQLLSHTQI